VWRVHFFHVITHYDVQVSRFMSGTHNKVP
jgi:hypothetical protein